MPNVNKRTVLLVALITIVVGGIAVAYFTSAGSGAGSGSVGNASTITLSATTAGPLYPDGSAQDVAITVTNPGGGNQHVNSVQLASISVDAGHSSCVVTISGGNPAFTMADVSVAQTITPGGNVVVHGSVTMNDTGVSQDNCQGATLTLNLTSN